MLCSVGEAQLGLYVHRGSMIIVPGLRLIYEAHPDGMKENQVGHKALSDHESMKYILDGSSKFLHQAKCGKGGSFKA